MKENEKTCTYALSRILMYEPRIAQALVRHLGCAQDVFSLSREQMELILGPYSKYTGMLLNADLEHYDRELEEVLGRGCRYITATDCHFPTLLSECEDAPIGLFVQSDDCDQAVFTRENISIVGTREMSPYGRAWCTKIVNSLGQSKVRPTIVSGLAFGVDITAHTSALEVGLPTIAVLGTGIFRTYPASHQKYADRIARTKACAVVSEYPPMSDVTPINFLSRNRIIAGMSRCTLLIESRIKGGGMSTARTAASYNREVFALPGRNDDIHSQGCNFLIHSHIAEPIIGCDEFFKSLDYKLEKTAETKHVPTLKEFYQGSMDDVNLRQAEALLREIRRERGIQIQELADRTGIAYRDANILLRRMENDGFIIIDMLQQCSELGKNR